MTNNNNRSLYTGLCNGLKHRVWKHKTNKYPGFTQKYKCYKLVYYENYQYIQDAIIREKQIKNWRREKKVNLINIDNPGWNDLAQDWYDEKGLSEELKENTITNESSS